MTRNGSACRLNVCTLLALNVRFPSVGGGSRANAAPVFFEDETEQIASEYYVVSTEPSPTAPRGAHRDRFTNTSTSTLPSIASPTQAIAPVNPRPSSNIHSRAYSMDSLISPRSPREYPSLADFNEAFLLRHFQKTLGPWVTYPASS
jgi:hypothetical protein